jgi:hypothetical protein
VVLQIGNPNAAHRSAASRHNELVPRNSALTLSPMGYESSSTIPFPWGSGAREFRAPRPAEAQKMRILFSSCSGIRVDSDGMRYAIR